MKAIDPITGAEKEVKAGGDRVVAIGASTVAALRAWRVAFLERALAVGAVPVDDPYVFTYDFDGAAPWRLDRATKQWSKLRELAARIDDTGAPLPDDADPAPIRARLHDVRHFVATELLAAGIQHHLELLHRCQTRLDATRLPLRHRRHGLSDQRRELFLCEAASKTPLLKRFPRRHALIVR
jgi:integrase